MASTYTETPDNYSEIKESVVADIDEIKSVFFKAEKVLFYDACSFQRHSNLRENEKSILIRYFENRGIAIFLTRCILMELSGDNHVLKRQFIEYTNKLKNSGASKIDSVMRRTNQEYRGSRIILFSTPKLIQHMFQEGVGLSEDEIVNLLSQGISENIVIMGIIKQCRRVFMA